MGETRLARERGGSVHSYREEGVREDFTCLFFFPV